MGIDVSTLDLQDCLKEFPSRIQFVCMCVCTVYVFLYTIACICA